MALIALAFNAPVEARARFPNYRLTQLVASRIGMDPAELEELEELEELIGRKLCASVEEMPRLFNEQLRHVIKVHALGSLFKADGPGPHHHAVRPAGYDFDADEVIAARMERWRADYRAMATENQMLAASIVWLFRAGADNRWLRRVPMTWHAAEAIDCMKRTGVLADWAQLIALYPGW
jgi:hypothetical protein